MKTLYFLGIDISKKTFNAALTLDGSNFHEAEVENTTAEIQSYFQLLKKRFAFAAEKDIVFFYNENKKLYKAEITLTGATTPYSVFNFE